MRASFPQLWEEEHRGHRAWQESGFHGPRRAVSQALVPERSLPARGKSRLVAEMLKKSRCCTHRHEDEEVLLEPWWSNSIWGSQARSCPCCGTSSTSSTSSEPEAASAAHLYPVPRVSLFRAGAAECPHGRLWGPQSPPEQGRGAALLPGAEGSPASQPPPRCCLAVAAG